MESACILESLFPALAVLQCQHAPASDVYRLLKQVARREIEKLFSDVAAQKRELKPFGEVTLPYCRMGAVDSLDLFDLDELIIFSFYWANRDRYRRVLDLGANIGLHSIILSKCGFEVRAYEPDPQHFEILQRNLALNGCSNVETFNAAVSSEAGIMEFVRILGNTTGSHLVGSKPDPYGVLERLSVQVEAIEPLTTWADLIKLDVEGHEKEILLATGRHHWQNTDALVEVGSTSNAAAIYGHLAARGVNLFSQKTNWQLVGDLDDMPGSHHEGTLFVTCRSEVPWR